MPSLRSTLATSLLALLGATPAAPARPEPAGEAPRLVLFLVVDQARADDLVRFRPLLTGGLGRLLDESVRFTAAYHDHAATVTAPGHATLASGVHPRRHGVISNEWYDPETGEEVESVEDPELGVSPRNLLATTLGDWLKAADPASRVYAAGGKDRSAVLLAGHRPDGVYWYDEDVGGFVSSAYYPDPELAAVGGAERWRADRYLGALWEPTFDPAAVAAYALEEGERGPTPRRFPHSLADPVLVADEDFHEAFGESPFLDEAVAELGIALVERRGLGDDEAPDFLALSFSAVDKVGHRFGPSSPEHLDTLLRLDRQLGRLLAVVEREVGLDRVVVSLASDHGVSELPELSARRGEPGRRLSGDEIACEQRVGRELAQRYPGLLRPGPRLGEAALARYGLGRTAVEGELRAALARCGGVARVLTRGDLEAEPSPADPLAGLYARSFYPGRSGEIRVQRDRHVLHATGGNATTHGSPYLHDRHVPWLLRLPGAGAGRGFDVPSRVATVDVAPTLAALLGLATPEPLDGVSRLALLRPAAAIAPAVVTAPVDGDSDDPAVWIDSDDPAKSLILGTDKGGALYVFDLAGRILADRTVRGLERPNNVDVEQGVDLDGRPTDVAVVSERDGGRLRVFRLPGLEPLDGGGIPLFAGDPPERRRPMGVALYRRPVDGAVFVFVSRKEGPRDGYLGVYRLAGDGRGGVVLADAGRLGAWSGEGEIEAVVVDDELGYLYYADEGLGVWKYAADPDSPAAGHPLALFAIDGFRADREGLSIVRRGEGRGYLLVSDQQAGLFRVYPREGLPGRPHDHPEVGVLPLSAVESDGSEAVAAALGAAFPHGLFVAMSDDRTFQLYRLEELEARLAAP